MEHRPVKRQLKEASIFRNYNDPAFRALGPFAPWAERLPLYFVFR